ncbi:hypothetical protein G3580_17420 [Nitrogeniibacter mangrovi]|uniref:Zinc-binding protein n=1 Tax=Nitrogeniibacter mangrovi TaxID=2016596 RepID=A0A6C1BA40_9RHOO|nr:putative zinc-binding protein [Nitrogeniibacter mangrovi]QID19240.1 hypothetical protein G3580_17420 [Nitrogeniibacter mangrovi]
MTTPAHRRAIVYSCSGCSSAAQLANHMALRLDRERRADMSCIAGVGGGVEALMRLARSGRPLLALDGCALACVHATLTRRGLTPAAHLRLDHYGVRKRKRTDFDPDQAEQLSTRACSRRWGCTCGRSRRSSSATRLGILPGRAAGATVAGRRSLVPNSRSWCR